MSEIIDIERSLDFYTDLLTVKFTIIHARIRVELTKLVRIAYMEPQAVLRGLCRELIT